MEFRDKAAEGCLQTTGGTRRRSLRHLEMLRGHCPTGRAAVPFRAASCILDIKLGSPDVTVCATCRPPVPLCRAPGRVELWLLCLIRPSLAHPGDGVRAGGRAAGDITSNGPECGNSVNKVYFTFNFGI